MENFNKIIDNQFLIRVITNSVNPEEKEYFESWLQDSEENREQYGNLLLIWEKAGELKVPHFPDINEIWSKIQSQITAAESAHHFPDLHSKNAITSLYKSKTAKFGRHNEVKTWTWIVRIAAVLLISFSIYFLPKRNPETSNQQTVIEKPEAEKYEWITSKGEKAFIPLSDGSEIYLNADSRLVYPKKFDSDERKVELYGEAYFVIAKDPERPFKVIAGETITEVVGTEFNIRTRFDQIQIVVVKGVVNSYSERTQRKFSLARGELLNYTKNGGFENPKKVDVSEYTAWKYNKLAFNNTPMTQVVQEIEIFYNVRISILNESIKNKRLTGVFEADSLDDVLSAISLSLNVDINRKGNTITFN